MSPKKRIKSAAFIDDEADEDFELLQQSPSPDLPEVSSVTRVARKRKPSAKILAALEDDSDQDESLKSPKKTRLSLKTKPNEVIELNDDEDEDEDPEGDELFGPSLSALSKGKAKAPKSPSPAITPPPPLSAKKVRATLDDIAKAFNAASKHNFEASSSAPTTPRPKPRPKHKGVDVDWKAAIEAMNLPDVDEPDENSDDERNRLFGQGDIVMEDELQHHAIIKLGVYKNLPPLRSLNFYISLKNADDISGALALNVDDMLSKMYKKNFDCIVEGLRFTQYLPFVNCARIEPSSLFRIPQTRRVSVTGYDFAIFTTIGEVRQSFLHEPFSLYQADIHGLALALMPQETRRESSIVGKLCRAREMKMVAPMTDERALIMSSRLSTWNAPNSTTSSTSSPTKGAGQSVTAKTGWAFEKFYNEQIPVFDGRASKGREFKFTAEEFQKLRTRKQWPTEIPEGAIVAVGYTVNSWGKQENKYENVAYNLLFAIILHIPATAA
ncbi:hypothetical protein BDN72DRAFT_956722 [Pluteus cervinus]|uniref:Uncharacterized protein n=1 Tax=Pluteus cervinus TaxID=181527 RepID=A0ACD3B614_9AGAR|nr:hypothetical protein BDN72DRAFT_956722 [Pluteus cervinus]